MGKKVIITIIIAVFAAKVPCPQAQPLKREPVIAVHQGKELF
jgi:hypothetical protein